MPHDSPHRHGPADLPPARRLLRAGSWSGAYDCVVLDYDARFLRRKRLVTVHDEGFLVDLAETVSLQARDALELEDGRLIEVLPAEEPLLELRGDLARLAWHIGNRHTPCQIEADRLLIRQDHVLEAMLRGLGARLQPVSEPFTPEGGAYGLGRTLGHDHGHGGLQVHHHGSHGHPHDDDDGEGDDDARGKGRGA
jgi:urease accessory protein